MEEIYQTKWPHMLQPAKGGKVVLKVRHQTVLSLNVVNAHLFFEKVKGKKFK